MKILVFTKYSRKGASSRLRTLQYLPYLEQLGFEFTVQNLFNDFYLETLYSGRKRSIFNIINCYTRRLITLLTINNYDLIWIEKELFPYIPFPIEKLLSKLGYKYLVDYDDAIFHNYDLSNNRLVKLLLSNKIDKVMKYSTCVVAGNSYLAQRAENANAKNIHSIPTVVDYIKYKTGQKPQNGVLIIGWIGSPSTQKYLLQLKHVFNKIFENNKNIRLLLVGAHPSIPEQMGDIPVEVVEWDESTEVKNIKDMDIGIMPLIDGPWEKGKCGYKLIQYMACGIPVVASPVGVNIEIIKESNSGFLADKDSEWIEHLSDLINSHKLRTSMGNDGQLAVKNRYSLQSQSAYLAKVLKSLI